MAADQQEPSSGGDHKASRPEGDATGETGGRRDDRSLIQSGSSEKGDDDKPKKPSPVVRIDTLRGVKIRGVVESFSPGTGA